MKADFKGGSNQSIYFRENHLMVVDGYYSNRIRRLYYKDLQVLYSCYYEGRRRAVGIVLLCFLLSLLILVAIPAGEATWIAFFVILFFWAIVGSLICFAVPNRKVFVQTGIQRHGLTCVCSPKKYARFKQMLAERLGAVGNWGEQEQLLRRLQESLEAEESKGTPPPLPQGGFSL